MITAFFCGRKNNPEPKKVWTKLDEVHIQNQSTLATRTIRLWRKHDGKYMVRVQLFEEVLYWAERDTEAYGRLAFARTLLEYLSDGWERVEA